MFNRAAPYETHRPRAAEAAFSETSAQLCSACGVPFDSQYFDVSGVFKKPVIGETRVLAEFDLPPQYCGVLEYFAQFTDQHAKDLSLIETAGVEWQILADGSPLFPYLSLDRIVNPWGASVMPVAVRLPESTRITMVARGVALKDPADIPPDKVGGRLLGRYWYNAVYDQRGTDAGRRRY
ncbi:MAG: hypothetical protein HOP19_16530 [Acidobacteria bacterium]|nr:hypothetical protein [Acidobacteriota bacterium]